MKRFLMASLVVAMVTALLASSAGGWTNVYGEESPSSYSSAEAVAVDAAGGVIVAGCFSGTFNGESAVDSLDDYVMRLSSSGSVDWILTWDPEPEVSDCKRAAGGMVIDGQGTIFLKQEEDDGDEVIRAIAADGSSNEVVATTSGTDIFERSSGFSLFNPDSGHVGFYSSSGALESEWQPGEVEGSEVRVLGDASGPDGAGGFVVVVSEDPFIELAESDTHVYRVDGTGSEVWDTLLRGYELDRSYFGSRYLVHGDELFLEYRYMSDPTCPGGDSICARLTVLNLDDGSLVELDRDAPSDKLVSWGISFTEIWNPDCVSENADQTVLTFETAGCDRYLGGVPRPDSSDLNYAWFGGVDTQLGIYRGPMSKRFQTLADGTLVGLMRYHQDRGDSGHAVGLFQTDSDGGLLPMRVSEIIAQPDQSRTYLTDFAVNSATGQVFVVGRVEGSTSVNLQSSGGGRSSLPNALVTSVTLRPAHGFFDVDAGGWRGTAVEWMRSSGVTTGCSATKFCPDQQMTREQQITFLWRYAGEPSPGAPSPFTDVEAGRYFTNPVTWAYNNGITNGVSPTSFGTGKAITRAQAVTFLHRQAGEPDPTVANPFVDVPAGTYYTDPVRWAFENGITTGTSPTTFDPNQAVTRVQFAAFLSRYDNLVD